MSENTFENNLKHSGRPIIIFGAGRWGVRLANTCKNNGISVMCFCDNMTEKEKVQLPIDSLEQIQTKYENPIFIVSPKSNELQMKIEDLLQKEGLEFYSITYFMQNIPVIRTETVMDKIWVNRFKLDRYKNAESQLLYAQSIDLMITEKCSLKCKDCGHLMQYYQKPIHRKKEDLFAYIDRVSDVFDVVGGMQILGGEPFMNPDVYDIVLYAQTKETIQTIHVVTNATILPDKEKLKQFDTTKVDFIISDYENDKQRIEEFRELFQEIGISCDFATSGKWMDYATIQPYHHTKEELIAQYKQCNTKNTFVLSYGNLYICPRIANAHTLHAMPEDVIEFVDLMDDTKTREEIKVEIKKYLYETTYLKGCNYCNGATIPSLPKAIQVKEPLSYQQYL